MRRRRWRGCRNLIELAVFGALILAGIAFLFLIPTVVWFVVLGILGGIGIMCLLRP